MIARYIKDAAGVWHDWSPQHPMQTRCLRYVPDGSERAEEIGLGDFCPQCSLLRAASQLKEERSETSYMVNHASVFDLTKPTNRRILRSVASQDKWPEELRKEMGID